MCQRWSTSQMCDNCEIECKSVKALCSPKLNSILYTHADHQKCKWGQTNQNQGIITKVVVQEECGKRACQVAVVTLFGNCQTLSRYARGGCCDLWQVFGEFWFPPLKPSWRSSEVAFAYCVGMCNSIEVQFVFNCLCEFVHKAAILP